MNTTTVINNLKVAAAVIAVAGAIFFGYSVAGYATDTFNSAFAGGDTNGGTSCSGCGGGGFMWDFGGIGGWTNTHLDGGGGGGGWDPTPYCTLSIVQGPLQSASYPPINQYIISWNAPLATSFSINNGIGAVTPSTSGTYTFTTTATSGTYTGTAVTPYGTVQCSGQIPPPPAHPPYCNLSASPSTITAGNSSTITWNTTAGTTFVVDSLGVLTPVGGGSTVVSPEVTTTYTGTVTGAGGTATCQTTVTVTRVPPQCTLDLTSGTITWTTVGAFQVLISPLTNSPQIPGLTGGTPSIVQYDQNVQFTNQSIKTDIATYGNGVTFPETSFQGRAFQADQATANRLCTILGGAGSTATTWTPKSFNSCNDNSHLKFSGSTWSNPSACGYNQHINVLTCQTSGGLQSYPLNGSYNFVPPLGYGTHTYRLIANGTGGTVQCEDTITNEEPTECKLEITKSANKTTIGANESLEYTINVKNVGNKKCTGSGVKIQDVLDPRVTYHSETHSSNLTAGYQSEPVYKASNRTVSFNAWDLDPSETAWIKLVVKGTAPTACSETVPNKAKITSYEYNNFTTWVESNVVNVSLTKDCTPPPPTECKLELTKSANKTTVAPDGTIEYTVNFKNTGTKKCTGSGVKLVDVLDPSLTYVSETHSSNVTAGYQSEPIYKSSTRTLSWNAWDVDPSETGWVKFVVKAGTPVHSCSVTATNKAKITSYEYNNFTTWVESNVVNVTIDNDCQPPATCSHGYWKNHMFWYDANDAHDVLLLAWLNAQGAGSDVLREQARVYLNTEFPHEQCDDVPPPPPTCTLTADKSEIYANSPVTFTWSSTNATTGQWVPSGDNAGTSGTATFTNIGENQTFTIKFVGAGGEVQCSKYIKVLAHPTECKMEITKTTSETSTYAPNDVVEYYITFINVGGKKCTGSGVKVQDVLDSRLTYQSETHSSNVTAGYGSEPIYKSSDRTVRWNAWDLEPGESGWVSFKAKVGTPTACTEFIPNKARITSYEYNNFNTWVESNTVNVTVAKDCHVPVPYCTMSIDPSAVSSGGAATLTWNTTNVSTATIDQGVGSVALSGSKIVNPTANTTYTGTFTGPGGTITCQATVTMTNTPAPQCTITSSASTIKSGESVIVNWTSQNVSSGTITGVGNATPVAGGSQEVFPADSTTFTGTFTGSYGTVTCSVPVTVTRGGGGCSGNCGGGLNQPNVVLLQKPPEAPLAFVTLDQIPYTGFEAGKALTLAFWLAVGMLAAVTTLFVMGKGGVQYMLGNSLVFVGVGKYDGFVDDEQPESVTRSVPNTLTDYSYSASVAAAPMPTYTPPAYVAPVAAPVATRPVVDGIPDMTDVIESRAHAAGVLMSPEAVVMARDLSADRGEALRIFGDILNEALRTLPREDGWIMLTSDRLASLTAQTPAPVTMATSTSTPSVEAILASVMTPPAAPVKNVEMPMANTDDQSVVMSLAHAILSGNRDNAYATARNLEVSGANATTVMTIIAGAFDQLYRARRHGLTTELSVPAMHVTDEALAKMAETFIHGMDTAYANPFTGLKLAVAQAFEARG
jgi:uncharacterized repeat protein (TIGR01451 family)